MSFGMFLFLFGGLVWCANPELGTTIGVLGFVLLLAGK